MRHNYLFTSESVTEGHPDKIADQISDGILDAIIAQDKYARVACETILTTGIAFVAGEISTKAYVEIPDIIREVIKDVGFSHAEVMREKYRSEAEGLTEKFAALGAMSDQARSHEEFRMQLEKSFEQAMASIEANKDIAREQADVLSTALAKANIDIVGGEGAFFDSFAKALSVGKAVEGVASKSPIVQEVLQKLLSMQSGGKDAKAAKAAEAEDA